MQVTFDQIGIEANFMGYVAPKPGWYIAPHSHQQYELHFITKGKGINWLEKDQFDLVPQMVYMAPPGEIHEQQSDMVDPMEIFFLPFSLTGLRQDLPHIHGAYPLIQKELQTILHLQQNVGGHQIFRVQMRIIELIWTIISPLVELKDHAAGKIVDAEFVVPLQIVEQALLYIQDHKLENPTLEQVARHCHISPRHLSRVFAEMMHMTVHTFIQQERFLWACRELEQTESTIDEISEALHLGSKQYFCHWFKRYSSKSPSVYRRES
ncbi:helix-turn-helix transcriptional regulator [Paenibacillus nasutitermitis]|uniref:AraC family transcriptional regulator n=1 Tax=Paenibacillus nasutitermitis TaxID=1652958 RepID=A0A916YNW9_9BACL|nr:AraC family transcriptional regulator [Paenibacillus nasutitermitis]GGD54010.1 AraC family transcriptional regulator [Paenibacillus nasutitermitis]